MCRGSAGNASCLCLYKARGVTCTQTEPRAEQEQGSGRMVTVPRPAGGTPWETQGLSWATAPSVSLKFFHLKLFFFFFKQIKFILSLKEAMKRLCFLLPERREEFVNSLTSYSKLQPRPVGPPETTVVSRTSRGFLSFFPGLPLLRAPPPPDPF